MKHKINSVDIQKSWKQKKSWQRKIKKSYNIIHYWTRQSSCWYVEQLILNAQFSLFKVITTLFKVYYNSVNCGK